MHGRRVLVTGGTGYIGTELVHKLISDNTVAVALVVRDMRKATQIFGKKVHYIHYGDNDVFNASILHFSPEIVVHLAAYSTSADTPYEIQKLITSNIVFTSHLLIALSYCDIKLFINTGSFSEYYHNNDIPSPTYFYSATKTSARYMIEYYANKHGFNFITAILFTVYGKKNKNKKIIDYAIEALESPVPVKMSEGTQLLDFVHIVDVVNFYYGLIVNVEKLQNSKIDYQIGSGKCISIRQLVDVLEKVSHKKANILWGANKSRKIDTKQACADVSCAQKELEYKVTISLQEGLKNYLQSSMRDD